ncbi:polymorphic toxin type 22 domain-containing protein [Paraburkholderia phymatum]|uniref:Filamentous haemagglutinin family outer membrane protein n=2 Tax=Paraburkholderia phymatum TaxID=148447 RepID=B2JQ67_PARP8|nr:polymorphic toxin type 22 domain-containing protein [Paraburkholderia phymatum]ACC73408.1 filamentous haemagglutinin family outer membrane protein [Paraburkholderia phymatum STM815]
MNRTTYRLVFSRLRGMLVAVEETATASGKSAGETRATGRASRKATRSPLRNLVALMLAVAPLLAFSQIVPGGAHAPGLNTTQNGIPQVNINKPSGAGVSMNTYSQFDVQKNGAILNNSATITNTQLAGYINGNPNFGPNDAAKIIVNQVNSSSASQINGYVEVAGPPAEVVIANGSGISVNGGGFINTSRSILTTGTPNFAADGSLAGFSVTGGNITVQGAGFNASNIDQVDLLARAVQVNAAIYAGKNLNVITGANSIDHNTLAATPITGNGPAPAVSIDVSNLGGMYSGKILLASNEYGVGVSNRGVIAAQSGDLTLTSQGKLVLAGQTNASSNISASARDGIDNSGTTYAQQNVSANTSGALTNSGVLAAQQNTTVNAGSVASTGTLGAGVNGDGTMANAGDLSVSATGVVTAAGRNAAGGNASVNGSAVNLAGSTTSAKGTMTLAANGGDLNLSGATTTAGTTLNARATGTLTNDSGALSSGGAQAITAGALSNNSGQMVSGATQTATVTGAVSNQSGTMQANGALSLQAGSADNTGGHIASLNADGLNLTVSGLLKNGAGGSIGGNGNVTIRAGQVANAGSITAVQNLIASAVQTLFSSGTLAANGNATLSAGTSLTNSGSITAASAASITASTFDNSSGTTQTAQFTLRATNLVNRNGSIAQTGTAATTVDVTGTLDNTGGTLQTNADSLTLGPATLTNDHGAIASAGTGTLSVATGALSNNGGTIATNGALDVRAGAVSNRGGTLAAQTGATLLVASLDNSAGYIGAQTVSVTDAGALNNAGGTIQADDTLAMSAQSVANDGGSIANGGTGATSVTATGTVTNTQNGLIGGNGGVSVAGGSVDNSGGTITAGGAVSVTSGSTFGNRAGMIQGTGNTTVSAQGAMDNTGGQIEADGTGSTLTVTGATLDNTNGRIANTGSGTTTISASAITNSNTGGVAGAGTIGGNGDVTLNAQTLSSTNGAQLVAGHDLTLTIAQLADNTSATLSGANNVTLNGPNAVVINAGGSIHGNGVVTLNTSTLDNTNGRIGNDTGSGGSIGITTGAFANQNGAIGSDQNLSVTTGSLTGDGRIVAGNDGTVTVNGDYTLTGANQIQANNNLTFTTAGNFTNQGTLGAVNALTLNAANVDNQAGADINSANTTVNAANAITNEGRIEGDSVTTRSASLSNVATIVGNTVTLNAGSIANTGAAAAIAAASAVNLFGSDISNMGGANIFSLGDVNIAADATRDGNGLLANRANSVTNDQSTIDAQGNIEIATQTLTNTRPAPTVETVTTDVETIHQTKRDKYMACTPTNGDKGYCTQDMWDKGYENPLNATFSNADVVSTASGPNAVDRVLVVNLNGQQQTIYYNSLTTNGDGTVTVAYWDDYDPHVNYDPGTEYPGDNQAHHHYQRIESARDTTTTTQQDQVTGPQAQEAQIMAGGNMVLANVGTLNNSFSAIGAGGAIPIGSSQTDGGVASGNYGGTTVNNTGQTLYQYQKQDIVSTYAWNEDISRDVGQVVQPTVILTPVAIGGLGGTIIANNAVQINATDINNTNVTAANSATGATGGTLGANGTVGGITGGGAQTVNLATGQTQTINAPQSVTGPMGALNIASPKSGLYTFNTAPGAAYLIATDPRLTSYTSFISSDYMLRQLGYDPSTVEKRMGDGLYETTLIRNQITQLTGRVYLQGYTNNEDEYRALMDNGVNVAKEFSLEPGMALTAAQMDALTSDIVWMVNQTVTLPDGSTQNVLAPVVYLAHTHANDLQPTGALISADDVEIHATGSATNSGVIKGGTQTVISATNIVNRGGSIGSSTDNGTTVLSATNDVVNASGRITGNRVAVLAGHDIVNTTLVDTVGVSSTVGNSKVTQTLVGAQGTIASTGDMVIVAGNDLNVHGASIAAGGNAQIAAGHDINVDTVESHTSQSVMKNADNFMHADTTLNQTSGISAGGSLAMQSGNDMTFRGASVSAGGDMAVVAGGNLTATTVTNTASRDDVTRGDKTRSGEDRSYDEQAVGTSFSAGGNGTLAALSADTSQGNVTLTGSSLSAGMGAANIAATGKVDINEAREEHDSYSAVEFKRGSFVHGSTTEQMQDTQANIGVGSTVSGDTVNVSAGKDLTVKGSTVAGTNDVSLNAAGNVNITTSQDMQNASSYYQKHESGLGTGGGIGISVGSKTQTDTIHDATVTNNGSTVGSLNGSLNIVAGNDLHVTGSDLVAAKNVTGTGANVTIDSALDTMHHDETHEVKQSGFTLAIKAPVIDAVSNTVDQARAASRSQNDRAAALHGMAAASGALDSIGAASAALGELANGQTPSAKIELSYGSSHSKSTYTAESTTNRGSSVTAGGTAAFVATGNGQAGSGNVTIAGSNVDANDVILAAKNQVNLVNTTDTDSTRSTNQSSSASVGVSYGTQGFGVDASASKAHGNANSDATMQNNTHVTAANTATIISGGDTNIVGANVNGRQVNADVSGNLNIASVQDTMTSSAHQESTGGGFAISQGGGSASFSHTNANANGSYAGVNEQAGIQAGDGGFNVNVKGNTDLKGATIASDADASKNNLSTGTLTYSDIQNQSSYNAHSSGFSAGATTGDGGSNYATHGPASGKNAGGGAPMLRQSDSGSDSATTRSGISTGTINVTNGTHQTQDVASLNRDTLNTNGTVVKMPDVNNILNNQADLMAAASAAGEAVSRRVGDFAQSKYEEAKANGDQAGMDAWKEGGTARAEMQAAGAALVTGLAGGNALGGAAGAGIASIAAGKLNELSGAIAGSNPTGNAGMNQALGNIVANAIAIGASAAVGGNAGAFSGYNADRYNRQLHAPEKTKAQQIASQATAQGLKNPDGSPITDAQIENAMRAANNSRYGEIVATGVVVPLNANTPASAVSDTTGMKLTKDGAGNNYLVQDPSMLSTPSKAVQDLIVQNTGGANSPYSWNPASAQTVSTPTIDPYGPFSPSWNTGDYSAGLGAGGRGLAPDYMTVNAGVLSANVSGVVNLYDGSLYAGGGVAMTNPSAVSYNPGVSTTFGYIFGAKTAQDVTNLVAGDGNQAFVSIPTNMGVNVIGAITHAYGGATAIEIGVGQPGTLSYGIVPWSHTTQVTGQSK